MQIAFLPGKQNKGDFFPLFRNPFPGKSSFPTKICLDFRTISNMELEEERPASKSVEGEKGSEISNKMPPSVEIRADSHDEVAPVEPPKLVDSIENCLTDPTVAVLDSLVEAVGSPTTIASPIRDETTKEVSSNSNQYPASTRELGESTPVGTKGNGLRKWRRIKRDLKKDGGSSAESAQFLKRRLQNSKPFEKEEVNKLKSKAEVDGEDSVASLESRNADINPLPVVTGALNLELDLERLASGGFSIGMDSDNSEDHNSKSSTATSAPRLRHEALASGKDRGRLKPFCGKGTIHLGSQKVQQGRGGTVDANKKYKGDLARFEENSLSSVESDLRSSVAGVVQWGSVVDSNGKHNGRSSNFDEHCDEAHTGEKVRSGYLKENGKVESLSIEDDALLEENNQKSGNFQSSSDLDPLIESMGSLQEAEEALEKEIQKIAAMGKQYDENDRQFEGIVPYNSQMLEAYLVDLRKKAENHESKLEEASKVLEAKEQKLRELESLLSKAHFLPIQAHEEELDSELEVLIKEKMEAEIEYLILTKIIQNWKILSEDHIALCKEQMYLAGDQEQIMLKLKDAEDKIVSLNAQKDKLEAYCKELVATENVLRLKNKACKFSFCVIVQLMFLSISFVLFLMLLLSPNDDVVPT